MILSQAKLGEIVGCSRQNIQKFVSKGIIKTVEGKIKLDNALADLQSHDLLDENKKLKKGKRNKNINEFSLPFENKTKYKTFADLTAEEKKQKEQEELRLIREIEEKELEAKNKNISLADEDELELTTYAEAKAHREKYEAKLSELKFKIQKGELVEIDEIKRNNYEVARLMRDSFMAFPHKMSLRISGKSDVKEIESILENEIFNILENLSQ